MYSSQDLSPGFLIPCSSSYLPHLNNPLPATQFSINGALQNSFSSSFAPPTLTANHSSVSSVTSPETAAFRKNHAFITRQQPEAPALFSGSVLGKKNNPTILGDLVHHDWEAVRYFLSSQVRPGGDVSRIYKCSVCRHEFPNAQAYGGHMSSHSKSNKKSPQIMKKTKRAKKVPLESCSGNGVKRLKAMDMDSVKGRIVAEEAVSGEIEQVDGDDEDWFKYLNCDAV